MFTPAQKIYFLFCGIVVALCISYVTYLAYDYRIENKFVETISTKDYWAEDPKWECKHVFTSY